MKKTINQIGIETEDNIIHLSQLDICIGEDTYISFTYDQIDIIINWLQEAKKEIEELKKKVDD